MCEIENLSESCMCDCHCKSSLKTDKVSKCTDEGEHGHREEIGEETGSDCSEVCLTVMSRSDV